MMRSCGADNGKEKYILVTGIVIQGGVAILISKQFNTDLCNIERDNEGRWIKGEFQWDDNVFTLASVYAPNDLRERTLFFDGLTDRISGFENWILGGDFNCI